MNYQRLAFPRATTCYVIITHVTLASSKHAIF